MRKKYIFIDPDGTMDDWFFLLISSYTNVIYSTQCSGVLNEIRSQEGFLVPIGGNRFNIENTNNFNLKKLKKIFHPNGYCESVLENNIHELENEISDITIWHTDTEDGQDIRTHLTLDKDALKEITEAWVPVNSPWGKGTLIWKNCD